MTDQTQDPPVQSATTQHPDDTQQVVSPMPQPQHSAVGSMHKEAGPTRSEAPMVEVLTPSETAPQLPQEVAEAGVEVSKDHAESPPDLTMHDKKMIDHAPVIAPVPTQPSGAVTLPLTEEKATEVLKHKDTKNSLTWLAELVTRIHEKMKGGA